MTRKKSDLIICICFCAVLAVLLGLYLLLPKEDYSAHEKRYLAQRPALTFRSVTSGDYSSDAEDYVADHVPGRDFLMGLSAVYERISLRQGLKDIYVGRSGRLYERPVGYDSKQISSNLAAISDFSVSVGRPVDLMLIPSSGYFSDEDMFPEYDSYRDGEIISGIYAEASDYSMPVPVTESFELCSEPMKLFYSTDHHWTSLGAFTACNTYLSVKGRPTLSEASYAIESHEGFLGSTYSRAALWNIPGETLELWHGPSVPDVIDAESGSTHKGVYYTERLAGDDMYTVFLDGNHSLVRTYNPDGSGKLLVIRDSFSNSLGCFLADSYEEVVLVDLRYYKQPVSELFRSENFDDVLVAYSLGNFMTDANLRHLE